MSLRQLPCFGRGAWHNCVGLTRLFASMDAQDPAVRLEVVGAGASVDRTGAKRH